MLNEYLSNLDDQRENPLRILGCFSAPQARSHHLYQSLWGKTHEFMPQSAACSLGEQTHGCSRHTCPLWK